jgi:hypothetical protein
VKHLHVEAAGAASHGLTDAAIADDPQRRAVDLRSQIPSRLPGQPVAIQDGLHRGQQLAGGRQQQREREIGGRVGENVRGVAERDAACPEGFDVDVVVAHRVVGDRLQARAPFEQPLVYAIGEQDQQPICLARPLGELVGGGGKPALPHVDRVRRAEPIKRASRQLARDKAVGHGPAFWRSALEHDFSLRFAPPRGRPLRVG